MVVVVVVNWLACSYAAALVTAYMRSLPPPATSQPIVLRDNAYSRKTFGAGAVNTAATCTTARYGV